MNCVFLFQKREKINKGIGIAVLSRGVGNRFNLEKANFDPKLIQGKAEKTILGKTPKTSKAWPPNAMLPSTAMANSGRRARRVPTKGSRRPGKKGN